MDYGGSVNVETVDRVREIIRRMKAILRTMSTISALILCAAAVHAQAAGGQQPAGGEQQSQQSATGGQQTDPIKQGQELLRDGKTEEALALFQKTAEAWPNSMVANVATGSTLDLLGKGSEARQYFEKAIAAADTPEHKAVVERQMAMSYAFEGNCAKSVEYEQQVFDYFGSVKDRFQQGEIADEAARVCIDAGDLDTAAKWYKTGHDTGLEEPGIKPDRTDLWNFRWEHAQARIAARRGDKKEAQKHMAAAKAILDKGTNPQQVQFFPYLEGYVAFYEGDYKKARDDLLKANTKDAFIECLLGQTYEKLNDKSDAIESYRKAAAAISHNPAAAYSVPFAKKRLAALG
jgi:tetratricopeptide (TPR) repeat protein